MTLIHHQEHIPLGMVFILVFSGRFAVMFFLENKGIWLPFSFYDFV